ncbi:MAG: hypothetical protein KatS3mg118_2013 [Paracoccaceae bacterium]|nr:MAG: hypothetical protein KatS3mg118_2013 [Paracoccaceae bacterium]
MPVVSLIGHGAIGRAVAADLPPGWRLGAVLTRTPGPGRMTDPARFLALPCDLIIEAAGPGALRAHGAAALAVAPVWSVGAAALADPALRAALARAAARSGHRLRLFANGIAGVLPAARALTVTMRRPGLGPRRCGTLAELLAAFPDDLNSATAAALAGPGIDRTRVVLEDSGPGGAHEIRAEGRSEAGSWTRVLHLAPEDGRHPVAAAILEALRRAGGVFDFD